jgi:hypothetical protein
MPRAKIHVQRHYRPQRLLMPLYTGHAAVRMQDDAGPPAGASSDSYMVLRSLPTSSAVIEEGCAPNRAIT